jgi:hypothetical protein
MIGRCKKDWKETGTKRGRRVMRNLSLELKRGARWSMSLQDSEHKRSGCRGQRLFQHCMFHQPSSLQVTWTQYQHEKMFTFLEVHCQSHGCIQEREKNAVDDESDHPFYLHK